MRKLVLFFLLMIPMVVKAEVVAHYIDAEIEIAGALNVKELIVVKGKTKGIKRSLNHKMINETWDGNTIDDPSIYNGESLENIKVAVFKTKGEIDFNELNKELDGFLEEYDSKIKQKSYFKKTDADLGTNLDITHFSDENNLTAFYIEYIITNVVVIHKDISELNYRFLNLNLNSENTLIRIILPYPEEEDLINAYISGPSNGEFNYLTTETNNIAGIIASFSNINSSVNVRLLIPKEQVGIDMFLNKTNINALDKIKKIEQAKIEKAIKKNNNLKVFKIIVILISVLYIPGSYILYKFKEKPLTLSYLLLGIILMLLNILLKYNIIYFYFILIFPIIMLVKKD